jgi:hypothetical protein
LLRLTGASCSAIFNGLAAKRARKRFQAINGLAAICKTLGATFPPKTGPNPVIRELVRGCYQSTKSASLWRHPYLNSLCINGARPELAP